MNIKRYFTKSYWFHRHWKHKLARFILREYMPWDQSYLMEYLILQFTYIGLYFAKFGVAVDNHLQAHRCWEMRKALKDFQEPFDAAEKLIERAFMAQFKFPYAPTFGVIDVEGGMSQFTFDYHIPEDSKYTKEDVLEFLREWFKLEGEIEDKALDKFGKLFVSSIRGLWD